MKYNKIKLPSKGITFLNKTIKLMSITLQKKSIINQKVLMKIKEKLLGY